jgi:hypothetical protein
MKTFKDIASSIRGFMSAHRDKSLKSSSMLQALAGAAESTASLGDTLEKVQSSLSSLNMQIRSSRRPENKQCQAALASYQSFLKTVSQVANTRKYALTRPYMPIKDVLPVIENDLKLIMEQFDTVFSNDVSIGELRVSHAYVMGYIVLTQKLVGFTYSNMALLATFRSRDTQMPRWILRDATEDVEALGEFVGALLRRRHQLSKNIITDIRDIRRNREADVLLQQNNATLDTYVEEQQFSFEAQISIASGLSFNPAVWISSMIIAVERHRLNLRRKQAEFIVIRMAILEMELSDVDQNDPEYKRKRQIIDKYGNMLSDIRKKIDDVESRV